MTVVAAAAALVFSACSEGDGSIGVVVRTESPPSDHVVEILSPSHSEGIAYSEAIDWTSDELVAVGMGTASPKDQSSEAAILVAAMLVARRDALARIAQMTGKITLQGSHAGLATLRRYIASTDLTVDAASGVPGARERRSWYEWQSDGSLLAFQEMVLERRFWPLVPRSDVATLPAATPSNLPPLDVGAVRPPWADQKGPFTGLILDATGMRLRPAMSPSVTVEGTDLSVYQHTDADEQALREVGLVGYSRTVSAAKLMRGRVGDNPLVIPASNVLGSNIHVTPRAARMILDADTDGADIRRNCKVVFVTG